ncbi:XdhC family protein [Micromonospora sp. 4G57]|uniref:XdhC family protein n=1 Tax=Micromonospora sicca TaxID=2202420 RepID=A0ABU5JH58_9ACTN|nr:MULTISPECIES: XdhC family protein [unclassified Micromonospora]MDZ5443955.1 XdhC family protein [Micromonospora sp. 4G57]MDZ5491918.1 XdhC family protein [Micromonospora sp. 4G53]
MDDVLAAARDWRRRGIPFGLATVASSAAGGLTAPGDLLAVDPSGDVRGGIPAGCVESAVLDAARRNGGTGRARHGLHGPIHRAPDRARRPAGSLR